MKNRLNRNRKRKTDLLRFTPCEKQGKAAGIYIRVSENSKIKGTKGETERESIPQQRNSLIDYCKTKNWDYCVYDKDVDISGYEDELRPDLQRLLADIEAGKIHTIVCRELSRLARNEHLQSTIVNEYCRPYGVPIEATMEHVDITNPDGRLMAGIFGNRNESYLLYVAERSMKSKAGLVKKGHLRTTPPLGYGIQETDGVRFPYIKKDEEAVVVELFQRYTERRPRKKDGKPESLMDIRDDFQRRGIKTKRGGHWYLSNMTRLLRNPIFVGICRYDGKEHPSPYPAIIDRDIWDKAQKMLKEGSTGGKSRKSKHLLSGLLVCGFCEQQKADSADVPYPISPNYVFALGKTWHKVDGENQRKTYGLYRCQTKIKHRAPACQDSPSVAADDIEAFVRDFIARHTAKGFTRHGHNDAQMTVLRNAIVEAGAGIRKADKKIAETSRAYDADRISIEMVGRIETEQKTNKVKLEAKRAELYRKMEALEHKTAQRSLSALERWDSLTLDQQREHLANVIEKIVVLPGEIAIHTTMNPDNPTKVKLNRARVAPEWWQQKGLCVRLTTNTKEQADLQGEDDSAIPSRTG